MNFAAPSHLVRKALGRARELPEAAAEVVVVCPAEPAERPEPVTPSGSTAADPVEPRRPARPAP